MLIGGKMRKIKNKLLNLIKAMKRSYDDYLFVLGCLLIYIALFNIHINLGLISTGASFIYFAIVLHFDKKQKEKKQ